MSNPTPVTPATDEEIAAIRQMMLKGYVMPKVTYYANGGYMASGAPSSPAGRAEGEPCGSRYRACVIRY